MAQLTCKNLTLGYDNRAIQEDLNFSIDAGDYLCIVGENGSGKSTLMKTLLHLQAPISGSIELGDGLKKNEIGYLPQQTLVQRDFPASVREIVLSGCQSRCGKNGCPESHGKNDDPESGRSVLSRTFRRAAAAGSSCKSSLCSTEDPASG